MSTFWSASKIEPKRQFRWLFIIPSAGRTNAVETYYIKTVNKPSVELGQTDIYYLQHQFKYPGRLKWADINVKLIDALDPDTSSTLVTMLQNSGYKIPVTQRDAEFSFSKINATAQLNNPRIQQIDGGDTI